MAKFLSRQSGVEWIDLDRVAWESYAVGTPTYDRVVARFGETILAASGEIDRRLLARIVFSEAAARRDLERIVHPAVSRRLTERIRVEQERGTCVLLVEGALLTVSPYVDRSAFDAIVWLDTSDDTRRDRLRSRGRSSHVDRLGGGDPEAGNLRVDAEGTVADVAERVWNVIEQVS